jgi:hypothetical protein
MAGPWDNDPIVGQPVAPGSATPWANDPRPGAQFAAPPPQPALLSNEDWFRQTYGREPQQDPANAIDEAGMVRQREDYEGWLAWDNQQAAQVAAGLPNPDMAGNPNFRAHDDQAGRLRALGQGFFGLGDEAAGLVAGVGGMFSGEGFQPAYDRTVENERNEIELFRQQNPGTALTMELMGGLPAAAVGGAFAARGASLARQAVRGAGAGAGVGFGYGVGTGEGSPTERASQAIDDALIGGAAGGAGPLLARAAGGVVRAVTGNRQPQFAAPSREELRTQAQQAYARADEAGVVVGGPSWGTMVDDVIIRAQNEGLHPSLHPRLDGVLRTLDLSADGITPQPLQQVELMRRVLNIAGRSPDPDEQRLAGIVVDEFDDWLDNLTPNQVLAGDPEAAVAALNEARAAWHTLRKADVIAQVNERALNATGANYTQAGWETAIRQQLRAVANDPRRFNRFSPEEQAAILTVVRGGPVQNFFRLLGRFAPRGVVSAGAGVGMAAVNPWLAAVPVVGEASRRIATNMGTRNFDYLDALVRSGGSQPPRLIPQASRAGTGVATLGALMAQPQLMPPQQQPMAAPVLGRLIPALP